MKKEQYIAQKLLAKIGDVVEMNYIKKSDVEKIFNEHREKAFITCPETCFCWDIERILNHTHANGRK